MGKDKVLFIRRHGIGHEKARTVENMLLYPMPTTIKLSQILSATISVKLAVFRTDLGYGYFCILFNSLFLVIMESKKVYLKDMDGLLSLGAEMTNERNLGIPDFSVGSRIIFEMSKMSDIHRDPVDEFLKNNNLEPAYMICKVEKLHMYENHNQINEITGDEISQILTYEN